MLSGAYKLILRKMANYRNDLSQHATIFNYDGIHTAVFRLKAIMTFFLVETLDGSLIFDHCNSNSAIFYGRSLANHNNIAIKNSSFYHTFAPYFKGKEFFCIFSVCRKRNVISNFFKSQYGLAGSHCSQQRDL